MVILELYRMFLGNFDLSNITTGLDIILCGVTYLCLLLDALVTFVIVSILIKLITGKTIFYWFNKLMGEKLI